MGPFAVRRASVAFGLMAAAGVAAAQPPGTAMPPPVLPAGSYMAPASPPPAAGPVVAPATPLKDLTPPELHGPPPTHPLGGEGAACPPAAEHGHGEGGLFGSAEYLLLRPRRGAFDFATASNTRTPVPDGPIESLKYGQRSGVRAELGYRFADGWDVAAGYTFLRSAASRTLVAPAGGVLFPTVTRPGLVDAALTADASASLEYNVFDAVVGRRFVVDHRGSFRIFAGGRFATIRQDFDVRFDGLDAQQSLVRTRSNFDGFGPVIGADGAVNVWRGFQLYARASGGLLTGTVSAPLTETNQAGLVRYANVNYRIRKVVPTTQIGIGGGWQSGRVAVRAGYEITHWFDLVETPRLTGELAPGRATTRSEPFSLEGLFVQVGLSF